MRLRRLRQGRLYAPLLPQIPAVRPRWHPELGWISRSCCIEGVSDPFKESPSGADTRARRGGACAAWASGSREGERAVPAPHTRARLFTLERRLSGTEACVFAGFWVVFWSRFVSVRSLDSRELLMSADRVRHGAMEAKGPLVAVSKQPTRRNRAIWLCWRLPV